MSIVWGGIAPHPPIVIPEIGQNETATVNSTREALKCLALSLKKARVDTVVITSPHGPVFKDAVALFAMPKIKGDFAHFGAADLSYDLNIDLQLTEDIMAACDGLGVPVVKLDDKQIQYYGLGVQLDHGVLVPWYYFAKAGLKASIVLAGMSLLAPSELYAFGMAVQRAVARNEKRVAFLASADLSHRLAPGAPNGYHPDGTRFDSVLVDKIRNWDVEGVLNINPSLAENAGECGWRSIMMLTGAFDGHIIESQVFSYEGPFGVGYLVAEVVPQGELPELKRLQRLRTEKSKPMNPHLKESLHVQLARQSLETYVLTGKTISVPQGLPEEFSRRSGAFVSLKKHDQLRGCIGTSEPTRANLAEEIIFNAISAGTHDPRFWPVKKDELVDIVYSVDVLGQPEPIQTLDDLDPKKYGIIVRGSGGRTGLLLPDLEGVDTPAEQIQIAMEKAGLSPKDSTCLERFQVQRHP